MVFEKQEMKLSEARILVYLSQVDKPFKFARMISTKLEIGYNYTLEILKSMIEKGWLSVELDCTKKYYSVKQISLIIIAKELIKRGRQSKLPAE